MRLNYHLCYVFCRNASIYFNRNVKLYRRQSDVTLTVKAIDISCSSHKKRSIRHRVLTLNKIKSAVFVYMINRLIVCGFV